MASTASTIAPQAPRDEDLRERVRQLEAELAEVRRERQPGSEHLQAIIDHAPLAIYLKDSTFTYLLVNRQYERLSQRPRAETIGHHDFDVFPEPVARLFRAQDEEVIARRAPVEFKETIPLPEGVRSFITSKFPVFSHAGELRGVAGVCTDVTDLERARDRLEQAQADLLKQARLATLGELAAMVAHEVRNPLGVVFNAVAALRRTPVGGGGQSKELLEIIGAEADRLNRMVSALLELARPPAASFDPANVEALVSGAIATARSLVEPKGEVRLEVPRPVPAACLDAQLLRQALSNLICNALQAPQRQGPVKVRVELDEPAAALRISVIDDGAGVPAELSERVFAPFFTTRAAGTGLGLTVARRVAEAHRGTVTLVPTPGGGATFVLKIPFVPEGAGEPKSGS